MIVGKAPPCLPPARFTKQVAATTISKATPTVLNRQVVCVVASSRQPPSFRQRLARSRAQAESISQQPKAVQHLDDGFVVLLDPKRQRIIYLLSDFEKFRPLLWTAEPHAAFFMKEPGMGDAFALLRSIAEQNKLWNFVFEVPEGSELPEELPVYTQPQQPDYLASRRKSVKGSFMRWFANEMKQTKTRLSIHMRASASRFGDLVDTLRVPRAEYSISDSISLVQNRDHSSDFISREEGNEGSDEDGAPPRQPSSSNDVYDTELQLGPNPDDWTLRIRTGHGKAGSSNQQHLERCFADEVQYLNSVVKLEEQWKGSPNSGKPEEGGLVEDWANAQRMLSTTGAAKVNAGLDVGTTGRDLEGDMAGTDTTSIPLVRPVRKQQFDAMTELSDDEASSGSCSQQGEQVTATSSASSPVAPYAQSSPSSVGIGSSKISSSSSSFRADSNDFSSTSGSSGPNLNGGDVSDQELASMLLGRTATQKEVAEFRAALKQSSEVDLDIKGRRSGRHLRDVLDSFLQGMGVSIRIGSKKQRVRPRRSSRPKKRRLHIPSDVLLLSSDTPSFDTADALRVAGSGEKGRGSGEGAERRLQVEATAAFCLEQLRVPTSHTYVIGKDLAVVVSGEDVVQEIAARWQTLESRLMMPSRRKADISA